MRGFEFAVRLGGKDDVTKRLRSIYYRFTILSVIPGSVPEGVPKWSQSQVEERPEGLTFETYLFKLVWHSALSLLVNNTPVPAVLA